MDRTGTYTLCFSFPFNKETSSLYTEDDEINVTNINYTLNAIELVISSHGFISMETVMKYFGLRPTRHCPGIYFTELGESEISYDEINHTDVVTIFFTNEIKLRPVIRRRMSTDDILEEVQANDNKALSFKYNSDEQKEEEPECQTGQKEASESEEKETT